MDIQALAGGVLIFLVSKLGEGFAKKSGEKIFDKVVELYQIVTTKFKGDSYAEQTLKRLEEKPDSLDRQNALKGILVEKMEEDNSFSEILRNVVVDLNDDPASTKVIAIYNSVAVGKDISNSTIILQNGQKK